MAPTNLAFLADAAFAGVSVAVGIILLLRLEQMINVPLFDAKMLGSIVVFCGQPSPPPPKTFIVCTLYSFAAGIVLHVFADAGSKDLAALAGGLHLLLSKLTTYSFSSTVGVASHWAGACTTLTATDHVAKYEKTQSI